MKSLSRAPLARRSVVAMTAAVISLFGSASPQYAYAEPADTSPLPIKTIVVDAPRDADITRINAVSADGSVAVGFDAYSLSGKEVAIRWTAQTGVQNLDIPDVNSSSAVSISNDGSVIRGYLTGKDDSIQGFRWTKDKGSKKFGPDSKKIEMAGMSDSGSVVVGGLRNSGDESQAFYWTKRDGMQSLANDPYFKALKFTDTEAYAVSGDGSTIVGRAAGEHYNRATAFRWTRADGAQYIGELGDSDGTSVQWMGVSRDGTVVAGNSCDGKPGAMHCKAFRWTQKDGLKYLVPDSPNSTALSMSPDGLNVLGINFVGDQLHHFIWTKTHGLHDLGKWDDTNDYQFIVTDHEIIRISVLNYS